MSVSVWDVGVDRGWRACWWCHDTHRGVCMRVCVWETERRGSFFIQRPEASIPCWPKSSKRWMTVVLVIMSLALQWWDNQNPPPHTQKKTTTTHMTHRLDWKRSVHKCRWECYVHYDNMTFQNVKKSICVHTQHSNSPAYFIPDLNQLEGVKLLSLRLTLKTVPQDLSFNSPGSSFPCWVCQGDRSS